MYNIYSHPWNIVTLYCIVNLEYKSKPRNINVILRDSKNEKRPFPLVRTYPHKNTLIN